MSRLATSDFHEGQRVSCSLGTGVLRGIVNSIIHGSQTAWIRFDIPIPGEPQTTMIRLEDVEPISSISD